VFPDPETTTTTEDTTTTTTTTKKKSTTTTTTNDKDDKKAFADSELDEGPLLEPFGPAGFSRERPPTGPQVLRGTVELGPTMWRNRNSRGFGATTAS
jgi:hypothetical protein